MYIVENSHPAIVSRKVFNRAQEELSRRNALTPQSTKTSITSSGKYSRYALSEVLICGECGSRYKRVTWTSRGKKRIVWRCVNRLDNGKKYCKDSVTIPEESIHEAVIRALKIFNAQDQATYLALMKATIADAIGLNGDSDEIDLLQRRIDALNKSMLQLVNDSVASGEDIESHEDEFREISEQSEQLKRRIEAIQEAQEAEDYQSRIEELQRTIDRRQAGDLTYDDSIVRQMIECIRVYHGGRLEIIFGGGYEIDEQLDPSMDDAE
jgi:gas vesicle protein